MPEPTQPHATPERSGSLGEALVRVGLIGRQQLGAAQALADQSGAFLGQALGQLGFATEAQLVSALAKHCRVPHLNLLDYSISPDMGRMLPYETCLEHRVLPIDQLGRNVTLAMCNPLDQAALEAVARLLPEARIKPVLCSHSHFEEVMRRLAPREAVADPAPGAESPPASATLPGAEDQAIPEENIYATVRAESGAAAPRRPRALHYSLVCLEGWEIGREIPITETEHVIGRSPQADTTLNSRLVSREHARVARDPEYGGERVILTDLASSNGTLVNNVPVTSTALHDGDKILIGDVLFKFLIQDDAEARFHQDVHRRIHYHGQTGLLMPEAFLRQFNALVEGRSPGAPLCLILAGIDGLARVNDEHGRTAGSAVLSDLGDMVRAAAGPADVSGFHCADQVMLLCTDTPLEAGFARAEDLRRTVEARAFQQRDRHFRVTVSIGVAAWPGHGRTGDDLIQACENALREAKQQGRNRVAVGKGG